MKKNSAMYYKWITSGIIVFIMTALISFAVAEGRIGWHIDNEYVHNDIQALDNVYVRKDVQAEQFKAMHEKIDSIMREMGIE